jgi:oxygen-dependent protoporphyrinogen oxidase
MNFSTTPQTDPLEEQGLRRKTVVVIGAGISGLCTAYWLKKQGITVTILERDNEPGGTMKTVREDGWLIETGPNSALETTPLFRQIIGELGLNDHHLYANDASNKRYILRDGKLHPLPTGPGAFLRTRLWTGAGKLRLLKEPFTGRGTEEESVAAFVERRLGREFLDYAINPFVAGVFAGDPAMLSVRHAFPKLYALEEKYGGLIVGMMKGRKERRQRQETAKDRSRMFSFRDGMQEFPVALAKIFAPSLFYNSPVDQIIPMRAGKRPVYTLYYRRDSVRAEIQADAVVIATPAAAAAAMIRGIDPETARTLASIYYPPVVEIFLGFKKNQLPKEPDGFGYLIPEVEKRNILGTIWSSALFPNRAPDGHTALTSFLGGARQPELTGRDDDAIAALVAGELRSIMAITGDPVFSKIIRWEKAIPQYNLGYQNILGMIDRFEQNFQGAFFCANFRGGISVGDCLMSADRTAQRILGYLREP